MAVTKGSFYTSGWSDPNSPDCYYVSWELVSQNIAGNYSDIKWSVVGAGGKNEYWWTSVNARYVSVNGAGQSVSTSQETYNGTVAFSGTTRINHNNDGKKTFTIVAKGLFYIASGDYNSTGSGTWELPQIARATTPSLAATTVTMGSTMRITLTPADSSFKHKLRYEFGSLVSQVNGLTSGVDFTSQGTTYHDFTPPTSLGSEIPNANSGTCKLICYTYKSDGTHIGTITQNITINVPSYTPTISSLLLTGVNQLSSAYVAGKSSVKVVSAASSSYGASIVSYSATVDGKTYTGSSFTSSPLSAGTKSVVLTVTDSRGRTASKTSSSITVYAYSPPVITEFKLERQSNGTTVIATVKGTVASVNSKNAKNVTVKLNGVTQSITASSYTINGTTTFTGIPTDITFAATATITDSFGNTTKTAMLSTVKVTTDFYKDGTGIAFGKVAESSNLFECDWPTKFNKSVTLSTALPIASGGTGATTAANARTALGVVTPADYIIQTGKISTWDYAKWNNGRIELWSDRSITFPASTDMTSGIYRSIVSIDMSSALVKVLSGTCAAQNNSLKPEVVRHGSTPTTAEVVILATKSFSSFTLTCPLYIIGLWK